MLVTRHENTLEVMQSFERQHRVKLHAMLLLGAAGLGGLLVSRLLLHWGLHVPFLRFPIAVLVSYGLFLLLVDIWLWIVGRGIAARDVASLLPRGGRSGSSSGGTSGMSGNGGSFDGGGASASFAGPPTRMPVAGRVVSPVPAMAALDANVAAIDAKAATLDADAPVLDADGAADSGPGATESRGTRDSGKSSSGSSKGGGEVFAIVAFLVVLVACVGAVGWVIAATPGILVQTAVEAGVAGGMIRGAAPRRGATWFTSLCERTWRKVGLLVLLAFLLGVAVRMVDPQADTVGEAITRTWKYRL